VAPLKGQGIALPDPLPGLVSMSGANGWVHGDIQLQSLLHDADHQLRAVVDWGLLHWGNPLEDLVDAFVEVAMGPGSPGDRSRGEALLEAYSTLVPIERTAWTPIVARWSVQRMLTAKQRPLPAQFEEKVLLAPERLATAIASCLS
jgi:aminoglycoside phosphotransferase (APT) family kinase protein